MSHILRGWRRLGNYSTNCLINCFGRPWRRPRGEEANITVPIRTAAGRDPTIDTPGAETGSPHFVSDAVVDLLALLGVTEVAFNPGASFRGLQDSLVHAGHGPRIVLCLHETIAVSVAHGSAKATGRPMAVLLHDVVGLQSGAMAVYNAWCDRAPVLLVGGTGPVSTPERRPWIDWVHTALVQGQVVRDFVKWDDQPADPASIPESLLRAWQTIVAEPPGPAYVCLDARQQELPALAMGLDVGAATAYPGWSEPAPDPAALGRVGDRLATATTPVLVTDFAGATEAGFELMVRLAEQLAAPVIDLGRRLSFPTDHPLNWSGALEIVDDADVVVAVDVEDLWGALRGRVLDADDIDGPLVTARPGTYVAHVTPVAAKLRSWAQDYERLTPVDDLIWSAAAPALRALTSRFDSQPLPEPVLADRRARLGDATAQRRLAWRRDAASAEADGSVPLRRLIYELGEATAGLDVVVTHGSLEGWEHKLWSLRKPRRHLGWSGGGGLGYAAGASIGAALALGRDHFCVGVLPDGDLLFNPSALWTAAHLEVPVLLVVHNNRQYGNTVQHAAEVARSRGRDVGRRHEGAAITDPDVDHATVARGFGVWATGPVSSVPELRESLREAIEVVRAGRPALVDVLTTPGDAGQGSGRRRTASGTGGARP